MTHEVNRDKIENTRLDREFNQLNGVLNKVCRLEQSEYSSRDIVDIHHGFDEPNSYLLMVCTAGKARLMFDDTYVDMNESTCVLLCDGILKGIEIIEPSKFTNIYLTGPDINMLYTCDGGKYFHKILNIGNSRGFYRLLSKVFSSKWDIESVLTNSALIYDALLEFFKVEFDGGRSLSKDFVGYVEKNICSRIFVSQAAKDLMVSESKLTKVIRREMGVSPYSYILETKLKVSENDLVEGRSSIAEIAGRYGFDSCAAYVTAFKKKRKMSPTSFRDNWVTCCMKLCSQKV